MQHDMWQQNMFWGMQFLFSPKCVGLLVERCMGLQVPQSSDSLIRDKIKFLNVPHNLIELRT